MNVAHYLTLIPSLRWCNRIPSWPVAKNLPPSPNTSPGMTGTGSARPLFPQAARGPWWGLGVVLTRSLWGFLNEREFHGHTEISVCQDRTRTGESAPQASPQEEPPLLGVHQTLRSGVGEGSRAPALLRRDERLSCQHEDAACLHVVVGPMLDFCFCFPKPEHLL